jgi:predicted PurR-regulated permease PerM
MTEEQKSTKLPDVKIIKIDPWSVIKIILILVSFFVLYLIRDVILILVAAIILSAAVNSGVDALEKKGVRRLIGALLIYLFVLFILFAVIIPLIPTISRQVNFLIERLPVYLKKLVELSSNKKTEFNLWQEIVKNWLGQSGLRVGTLFDLFGSVFGSVFVTFMIFLIAFYMTVQKNTLRETLKSILPIRYKERLAIAFDLAQKEVGAWVRGIIILCLSVGLMAYLGLSILGVRYALVLAVVAGVTEIIPWIGPWLGGAIAVIITLVYSPLKAIFVAILFLAVQLLENNLLVPQVMKKVVGLNPLLVIIIVLIGGKIAGPLGVFLAVPVIVIISIFVKEYLLCRKISPKTS